MGAVDIGILIDLAKSQGFMSQIPLLETIPEYEIEEKYLCSVFAGWKCNVNRYGKKDGVFKRVDHPAFTSLRDALEREGYIKVQRGRSNGDKVLKPFFLNKRFFDVGEQFSCAGAMLYTLTRGKPKSS